MYKRRKVFSVLINETGEERLFSTADVILEDRYFASNANSKALKNKFESSIRTNPGVNSTATLAAMDRARVDLATKMPDFNKLPILEQKSLIDKKVVRDSNRSLSTSTTSGGLNERITARGEAAKNITPTATTSTNPSTTGTSTVNNQGGGKQTNQNQGGGKQNNQNQGGGKQNNQNQGGGKQNNQNQGGGKQNNQNQGGGKQTNQNQGGGNKGKKGGTPKTTPAAPKNTPAPKKGGMGGKAALGAAGLATGLVLYNKYKNKNKENDNTYYS